MTAQCKTYTNDSRGLPVTVSRFLRHHDVRVRRDQQLITQTDPAGGVTRLGYDSSGRVVFD